MTYVRGARHAGAEPREAAGIRSPEALRLEQIVQRAPRSGSGRNESYRTYFDNFIIPIGAVN